jgi:hypothetical protein
MIRKIDEDPRLAEAKANLALEEMPLAPEEEDLLRRLIASGLDAEARKDRIDAYLAAQALPRAAAE